MGYFTNLSTSAAHPSDGHVLASSSHARKFLSIRMSSPNTSKHESGEGWWSPAKTEARGSADSTTAAAMSRTWDHTTGQDTP